MSFSIDAFLLEPETDNSFVGQYEADGEKIELRLKPLDRVDFNKYIEIRNTKTVADGFVFALGEGILSEKTRESIGEDGARRFCNKYFLIAPDVFNDIVKSYAVEAKAAQEVEDDLKKKSNRKKKPTTSDDGDTGDGTD